MNQSTHLILFTLGPVQSFIAQARKTQDLYAGSRLLSDLIKTAINVVGKDHLIFPATGNAMPNRFLAQVPDGISDFQKFGNDIEEAVRAEWRKIANNTLKGISIKPTGFDEQINNHLEIFWLLEEIQESYAVTLKRMEKQLAAVKNVRPFHQFDYQNGMIGEKGRKCSLDGQRNVLFFGEGTNSIYLGKKWNPNALELNGQPNVVIGSNEGLSAVSFVKRYYKGASFPATAEITLMHDINQLDDVSKQCFDEYKKNVFSSGGFIAHCIENKSDFQFSVGDEINIHFDYQYLYRENIKEITFPFKTQREIAERYVKKLEPFLKSKYYAVLTFDGDDMGKWLTGNWLATGKELEIFHREFAKKLSEFAKTAKEEVNKVGRTVYAGGDDFLGFVNLYHLLPVLKTLRGLFREMVNDKLTEYRNDKEISFTAGICVAHYKEPLSLVLESARETQKEAKKLDGKNAFGITVIKGSGENHTTVLPLGDGEKNVEMLNEIIGKIIKGDFSNAFIKTIQREFDRISQSAGVNIYEQMFRAELERLLRRAANNKNWSKEDKKREAEVLNEKLMNLQANKPGNFFQMLHIADFFQRSLNILKINEPQTV